MDTERMGEIINGHERISDKIRVLHAAGFQRSEIATFLGRRYQQVRNVIKDDERRARDNPKAGRQSDTADSEGTTGAGAVPPESDLVRIGPGGIVEIPPMVIERLKIAEGDPVLVSVVGDEIRLLTRAAMISQVKRALANAQPEMLAALDAIVATGR